MMQYDVVIIGAGAAGLMCAIETARRGRRTLVIDHAKKAAEKIRISGGGRCNFTHLKATPKNFLSDNPSFCISALKRFGPWDFLDRVVRADIPYFEKTEGQLFCENSAQDIIDMLLGDFRQAGGELWLDTVVSRVSEGFHLVTTRGEVKADKLVMATGGLSIPKMGATGFAYDIARQFGHEVLPTRAGLVPFTLGGEKLEAISGLSGVSVQAQIKAEKSRFADGFLFTHRGLSGPSVLQISSYWHPGETVEIDLCPSLDLMAFLKERRRETPRQQIINVVSDVVPRRLAERVLEIAAIDADTRIADLSDKRLRGVMVRLQPWHLIPDGTEGYRTAEVTLGGVNTRQLSSQTMESQIVSGLYFIGECVDVTGWLGGYNFQWAWSSGWVAGQAI